MASSHAVSVGSTATELTAQNLSGGGNYVRVLIYNNGTATIYVGDAGVTTVAGIPVAVGASLATGTYSDLFAIAASGAHDVRVMEGV